jgi:hypothetical protein
LGTTLTHQNSIQEEIKSRLNSENAYYHLVQNLLSFSLQSKNLKIKIYRTTILPVLYGCETWSFTLREERSLRVYESRVLRRKFGGDVKTGVLKIRGRGKKITSKGDNPPPPPPRTHTHTHTY